VSLRSPLGRVLGFGSAGSGTGHWWQQRVTAAALALLGIWFVICLLGLDLADRGEILDWIGRPLNAALLALLVLSATWHSQLGVRVIIEDYVHSGIRIPLLVALQFLHALAGAVGLLAVLQIVSGGR
jgi:succinate dehydrogenase / fumarate reductase, membrane anchor subunit